MLNMSGNAWEGGLAAGEGSSFLTRSSGSSRALDVLKSAYLRREECYAAIGSDRDRSALSGAPTWQRTFSCSIAAPSLRNEICAMLGRAP